VKQRYGEGRHVSREADERKDVHVCRLYGSSQRPCWCEELSGENLQGLTELFVLLLPHLDDTPPPCIKGEDAVDSYTGGGKVR